MRSKLPNEISVQENCGQAKTPPHELWEMLKKKKVKRKSKINSKFIHNFPRLSSFSSRGKKWKKVKIKILYSTVHT